MKHIIVGFSLLVLSTGQVLALSCLRPTIEAAFHEKNEAKEKYVMVLGKLVHKRNVVKGVEGNTSTFIRGESYVATFMGLQSTRSGFSKQVEFMVAVKGTCLAAWCGSVQENREILTFLEQTSYGYSLTEGPCGGTVFYDPDKDVKQRALQCLRGGVCVVDNR